MRVLLDILRQTGRWLAVLLQIWSDEPVCMKRNGRHVEDSATPLKWTYHKCFKVLKNEFCCGCLISSSDQLAQDKASECLNCLLFNHAWNLIKWNWCQKKKEELLSKFREKIICILLHHKTTGLLKSVNFFYSLCRLCVSVLCSSVALCNIRKETNFSNGVCIHLCYLFWILSWWPEVHFFSSN